MYLKRHALQQLVAERSVRQRISKAKRVHYNKYQCFHFSSGLCLSVSQCILSDSLCAEPELDSIIITQLTSKRDLDKHGIYLWLHQAVWAMNFADLRKFCNYQGIRLYTMQPGSSQGFTVFKWGLMESSLWTKSRFIYKLTELFLCFWPCHLFPATSVKQACISKRLALSHHATSQYITSSTHMLACCVLLL